MAMSASIMQPLHPRKMSGYEFRYAVDQADRLGWNFGPNCPDTADQETEYNIIINT